MTDLQSLDFSIAHQAPQASDPRLFLKVLSLIEVAAFISLSMMVALWAQAQLTPGLAETLGLLGGGAPDFLSSALVMARQFLFQYGALLGLVILAGILGRRRPAKSYGLSRGENSLTSLIMLGLGAGFFVSIFTQSVFVARELWDLGPGTALWAIAEREPWDWQFWVFMGVGSFAFVPLVEELTWRGYVHARLLEHFKPGGVLLISTLFFSALHIQYFVNPDISKMMVVIGLLVGALTFGVLTLKTGSLLPAIVAHGVINTPASFAFSLGKIGLGLLVVLLFRKQISALFRLMLSWLKGVDTLIAFALCIGLGGAAYGLIGAGVPVPALIAGGCLVGFLGTRLSRAEWG